MTCSTACAVFTVRPAWRSVSTNSTAFWASVLASSSAFSLPSPALDALGQRAEEFLQPLVGRLLDLVVALAEFDREPGRLRGHQLDDRRPLDRQQLALLHQVLDEGDDAGAPARGFLGLERFFALGELGTLPRELLLVLLQLRIRCGDFFGLHRGCSLRGFRIGGGRHLGE